MGVLSGTETLNHLTGWIRRSGMHQRRMNNKLMNFHMSYAYTAFMF